MKLSSKQVRVPRSFRSEGALPAGMAKTSLALGISTALLLPTAAFAQAAGEKEQQALEMQTMKVESTAIDPNPNAQPGVPYKAQFSGDRRHTRPLAETPQTIEVLTAESIKDSGRTDLRDVLDGQPGITLGTGENGNAFGDRYIIRGQEARSDVFVDGLRDPGMTIRETFAMEQIEISKGPNSSFAGRGTAGGAINGVTKQATTDLTFTKLSAGLGTDDYQRYTVDTNLPVGEQFAVRANLLWAEQDVPDRDPASRDRRGIALSGLWRATDALDITLDYYGFRGHDNPDVGTYINRTTGKVNHDVPAYLQDGDFLQSDVDTYTGRVNYRFTDDLTLSNLTRYGTTDNAYVNVGAGPATTHATNPTGVYATSTLDNGHTGWQEVEYFANQTNLYLNTNLAGMQNEFIFGLEYTDHRVTRGNYSLNIPASPNGGRNCRVPGQNGAVNSSWCITDASGNTVSNLHNLQQRNTVKNRWSNDWNVETVSAYVMDTIDLTEDWTLFGGLRYDSYDQSVTSVNASTRAVSYDVDDSDHLVTGHLGVTYQITPEGMVYLSAATAEDINGGESDANGAGYGGLVVLNGEVGANPEKSESIELGTKWNMLDERLLLTAALFQVTKSDIMEGANYDLYGSFNTGENRVRGLELGATGAITENLEVQAGYTLMDSEVLKSVNPIYEGAPLANFAQNSSYAQLKYEFTEAFSIGAVSRYESSRYVGQPDTAAVNATTGAKNFKVPSYLVYDAFASYRFTKELELQLNVNNITDKDYYLAGYRSGNFIYIGDARSTVLTLNYEF